MEIFMLFVIVGVCFLGFAGFFTFIFVAGYIVLSVMLAIYLGESFNLEKHTIEAIAVLIPLGGILLLALFHVIGIMRDKTLTKSQKKDLILGRFDYK